MSANIVLLSIVRQNWVKITGMAKFKKQSGKKGRVDFRRSYVIHFGKTRNMRSFVTFEKGFVQHCAGNRSVGSLECDQMRIISIGATRNYGISFLQGSP